MKTKITFIILLISFFYLDFSSVFAAKPTISDFVIYYNVELDSLSPAITIKWKTTSDTRNFKIVRKLKSESKFTQVAYLEGNTAEQWRDTDIEIGKEYDYGLTQAKEERTAFAYFSAGIDIPLKDYRGSLLMLIDSTIFQSLTEEIQQLTEDIIGDGWQVHIRQVPRAETFDKSKVDIVANIIKEVIETDTNLRTLFLLGRVPVPYSGNSAIDGHRPQHEGAWPCDGYYQSLDKKGISKFSPNWTDSYADNTTATSERTWNKPGDGKFDNNTFPYKLNLECGRVDMYDLPAFSLTEEELLRRYLQHNHKYRNNLIDYKPRAIVNDFFGLNGKELFVTNAWIMFGGILGADKIDTSLMSETLRNEKYLFAYGSGAGSYVSCNKVAYTNDIVKNGGYHTIFSFLFGSWFGDWDSPNNLMRTVLAADPPALTCAWAARPYWYINHMGTDENIAYSALVTQNNDKSHYVSNSMFGHQGTHISLLGDPTLRIYTVPPVKNLSASMFGSEEEPTSLEVRIKWEYDNNNNIIGYNVYRAKNINEVFVKLNDTPIKKCEFVDKNFPSDSAIYQVRAINKNLAFSTSYFTQSTGKFAKTKTISNITDNQEISAYIFPNPAENDFFIYIRGQKGKKLTINIYDVLGKDYGIIYNDINTYDELKIKFTTNSIYKNLSLKNGVYFLKIQEDNNQVYLPLFIKK